MLGRKKAAAAGMHCSEPHALFSKRQSRSVVLTCSQDQNNTFFNADPEIDDKLKYMVDN